MTAKERVLAVHPKACAHQYGVLVGQGAPGHFTYQIFSPDRALSSDFDEEEAAWQNAAESLPAQPEQPTCPVCRKPSGDYENPEGCWHNVTAEGKIEYVAEPKPTPSTPEEPRCLNCDAIYGDHWGPQNHCHEGGEETWRYVHPSALPDSAYEPQPDSSSIPEIELELRRMMWLGHGHTGMYGDDGEMQCMECRPFGVVDYKREPLDKVRETFRAVQMKRMNQPRDSSSISTEQTFEEWAAIYDKSLLAPRGGRKAGESIVARAAWAAAKGQSNGR